MSIRERIGVDVGRRLSVEDAIEWAAANEVRYIDCQIDIEPNALESFTEARCAPIRKRCRETGVTLGLHTLSAVNIAEVSPFLRDAADAYLRGYIDAAKRLNADYVEVHAGYHFTSDKDRRMEAGRKRLRMATEHAADKGVQLVLENMNWEPELAEVHYLGHTIKECLFYFDAIQSPSLGWSFTINHATLVPEGIAGFLDGMPTNRLMVVRIADSNGEYELHMQPGDGMIDFADMFQRVEATGFTGHYMSAYGSLDDMLRGRDYLVTQYPEA